MLPKIKSPILPLLLLSLAMTTAAQENPAEAPLPPLRERFAIALKNVDRLTIMYPLEGFGNDAYKQRILFELKGNERIASFADIVAFADEKDYSIPCMCHGTHDICFYEGARLKFRLNYKHYSRLRSLTPGGQPFGGEFDLTKESAAAFAAWFLKQGFPNFQKEIDAEAEWLRQNQEKAARVAAMFPEPIRRFIPEHGQREYYSYEQKSKESKLATAFGNIANKAEILQICFRAIGNEYAGAYYERYYSNTEEPQATLYDLIRATSKSEQNDALTKADTTDAALIRGALVALRFRLLDQRNLEDATLAKLYAAAWSLQSQLDDMRDVFIRVLASAKGSQCMALRLKIARSGNPTAIPYETPIVREEEPGMTITTCQILPLWLDALLNLAAQRVPEARAIITEKLAAAPDGLDKLALEVALASYDGIARLTQEHLTMRQPHVEELLATLKPISK